MHLFKFTVAATLLALANAGPMHEDQDDTTSWDDQVKALVKPHQPLQVTPSFFTSSVRGPYYILVWDDKKFSAELGLTSNSNNRLDRAYYAQVKPGFTGMDYFYSFKAGSGYNYLMLGSGAEEREEKALLYPVIDITLGAQGTAPVKFNTHPVSRMGPPGSGAPRVTDQIDDGYIIGGFIGEIGKTVDEKYIPVYHQTVSGGRGFALCADKNDENTMLHFVLSGTAEDHGCTAVNIGLKVNVLHGTNMGSLGAPPTKGST